MVYHAGEEVIKVNSRKHCLQKRCIRILFGRTYSFDHHEFYYSCARTKTYTEHMAQKDFNLEHTKPLFVKNNLLTLHNLYIIRSLNELLKIVKFQSPISLFTFFKFLLVVILYLGFMCPESNLKYLKETIFIML